MVSFIIPICFIVSWIIWVTYYYYMSAEELEEKVILYKNLMIRAKNLYKNKKDEKKD